MKFWEILLCPRLLAAFRLLNYVAGTVRWLLEEHDDNDNMDNTFAALISTSAKVHDVVCPSKIIPR